MSVKNGSACNLRIAGESVRPAASHLIASVGLSDLHGYSEYCYVFCSVRNVRTLRSSPDDLRKLWNGVRQSAAVADEVDSIM